MKLEDLDALRAEWEATFDGDAMPWGFEVGPEQVPIMRDCIARSPAGRR